MRKNFLGIMLAAATIGSAAFGAEKTLVIGDSLSSTPYDWPPRKPGSKVVGPGFGPEITKRISIATGGIACLYSVSGSRGEDWAADVPFTQNPVDATFKSYNNGKQVQAHEVPGTNPELSDSEQHKLPGDWSVSSLLENPAAGDCGDKTPFTSMVVELGTNRSTSGTAFIKKIIETAKKKGIKKLSFVLPAPGLDAKGVFQQNKFAAFNTEALAIIDSYKDAALHPEYKDMELYGFNSSDASKVAMTENDFPYLKDRNGDLIIDKKTGQPIRDHDHFWGPGQVGTRSQTNWINAISNYIVPHYSNNPDGTYAGAPSGSSIQKH